MAFFIREKTFAFGALDLEHTRIMLHEIGAWCVDECPVFSSYSVEDRSDSQGANCVLTSVSGKSALMCSVYGSFKSLVASGAVVVNGVATRPTAYGIDISFAGDIRVLLAWTDYGYVSIVMNTDAASDSGSILEVPVDSSHTKVLIGGLYAASGGTSFSNCFSFPCKVYNETTAAFYDVHALPIERTVRQFASGLSGFNAGMAKVTLCTNDPSVEGCIPHNFDIYRAAKAEEVNIGSSTRYITTSEGDFLCAATNYERDTSVGLKDTPYNILLK